MRLAARRLIKARGDVGRPSRTVLPGAGAPANGEAKVRGDLAERLPAFVAGCTRLREQLVSSAAGRYIGEQLVLSSGAAEAAFHRSRSTAGCRRTVGELGQSCRWLELVERGGLLPELTLEPMLSEARALLRLLEHPARTGGNRP